MYIFHILANKDFRFTGGVFGLENQRIFLFFHSFQGSLVTIDGNNGNISIIHISLLADKEQISMMDACVYHAVPFGSEPEVGFARLEVRFGGGDVAFYVVLGE